MHTKVFLALAICFFAISCNRNGINEMELEKVLQLDTTAFISSSAAIENNDSAHQFIRTADLKFKVKSVLNSTYDIENITMKQGGFVTYTNLASNIDYVFNTKISTDSSLETTHYTVSNNIILRVPNIKLDTTLKEISKNIDYLDYRIIKADDVALQILSNDLTIKRAKNNEQRLTDAIDKRGKKLNETTKAGEALFNKQVQADDAEIANLSLDDQINFSTINLIIYQRPSIRRELIANEKNIDEYEPGLGNKIAEALKSGWNILETFIVFLIQIWGFLLLALITGLLISKYRQHKKN